VPEAAGLLNQAQQVAADSNSLSAEVVERVTGEFFPAQRDRLRRVRVLDLGRPIDLASGYVEVNVAPFRGAVISPDDIRPQIEKGVHPSEIERLRIGERQLVSLSKAVKSVRLAVLVGDPGAGKSTQLRHLCMEPNPTRHGLVPVFVAVRDLSAYDGDLIRAVGALLYRATTEPSEARRLTQAIASRGRLLLCLDGLDELDEANPAEARSMLRRIRVQIDELLAAHQDNRVVVSVRRETMATCQPELPADYQSFEVLPLTPGQIRDLIKKWFSAVDSGQGDALLRACEEAGWPGYVSNPLLVVLTCIVFERRNRLPDRPSELYRRCLDVLLEEWDATRRLSRHEIVAGFTTERKLDLLAETAFEFHMQRRCSHYRSDVVEIVARHLPKVGMDPAVASAAVGEIANQHGLLRSWSIEGHLALPHLCFQEYLAAKALRDRPNGDEFLIERVGDVFWHEVIRLYASQGDTAQLIDRLLSGNESFLRQRLFVAASCLSRGAKVSRPELRSKVISALNELAKGSVLFLKKKAIDALSGLETMEANDVLRLHFRKRDGKVDFESYASRYAIRIDGNGAMQEMTEAFIKLEDTPQEVLHALRGLPRERLIPILVDFINNESYPVETKPGQNFCVRHRRRDSAKLLAEIGESDALPHLLDALRNTRLTEFEREGMVRAIAMLPSEAMTRNLQNILADETLPTDCRVSAAQFLGDGYPEAGSYLRGLVGDKTKNSYDRRDAAAGLKKFSLSPADVPLFKSLLLDDRPDVFWGGPAYAAEVLHQINDPTAKAALALAQQQWRRSRNPDKGLVLQRIVVRHRANQQFSNRAELIRYLAKPRYEDREANKRAVLDYYSQHRDDAIQLFEQWLGLPSDECGFVPVHASFVIESLNQISITPGIARALVELATRHPWDERLWSALEPYDSVLDPGKSQLVVS
jgi:NACHT domain